MPAYTHTHIHMTHTYTHTSRIKRDTWRTCTYRRCIYFALYAVTHTDTITVSWTIIKTLSTIHRVYVPLLVWLHVYCTHLPVVSIMLLFKVWMLIVIKCVCVCVCVWYIDIRTHARTHILSCKQKAYYQCTHTHITRTHSRIRTTAHVWLYAWYVVMRLGLYVDPLSYFKHELPFSEEAGTFSRYVRAYLCVCVMPVWYVCHCVMLCVWNS